MAIDKAMIKRANARLARANTARGKKAPVKAKTVEKTAEGNQMRIIWKQWTDIPNEGSFGHGVHFHDRRKPRDKSLVAWLKGYEWLHGNPETVTIWCIAPDAITTPAELGAMKKVIEAYVKNEEPPRGKMALNIVAWPNA